LIIAESQGILLSVEAFRMTERSESHGIPDFVFGMIERDCHSESEARRIPCNAVIAAYC